MRVKELYSRFPNVLILHGVSKFGAESDVPSGTQFVEQAKFAIDLSKKVKLSTFSFVFMKNKTSANLFGRVGIIIKDGLIAKVCRADCGLRADNYEGLHHTITDDSYDDAIFADRDGTNEIILKNVEISGMYVSDSPWDVTPDEIHNASVEFRLPVYYLTDNGMLPTSWDNDSRSIIYGSPPYLTPAEVT